MKKQIFRQNNPNSSDYDSNVPIGYSYWEEVDSDEKEEEDCEPENDEE